MRRVNSSGLAAALALAATVALAVEVAAAAAGGGGGLEVEQNDMVAHPTKLDDVNVVAQ